MATATYNLSCVLRRAWDFARIGARRFGGTVRQYLPEAMRLAWAHEKKKAAAERVAQEERVRAAAFDLVAAGRDAATRREEDRRQFKLALAEELARPRIRPPVMTEETRAWLACFGAAQQREAAAKAATAALQAA